MSDELLRAVPGRDFRVFCVWVPVLPADNDAAATRNEASMKQRRMRHYWDPGQRLARHMAGALGIELAWDVYLLYRRGEMEIERPAFWMHQLETTAAPRLDVGVLAAEALRLMGKG